MLWWMDVDAVGLLFSGLAKGGPKIAPTRSIWNSVSVKPDHALRHRPGLGNGAQAEGGAGFVALAFELFGDAPDAIPSFNIGGVA